jgi:hypothetical protein
VRCVASLLWELGRGRHGTIAILTPNFSYDLIIHLGCLEFFFFLAGFYFENLVTNILGKHSYFGITTFTSFFLRFS